MANVANLLTLAAQRYQARQLPEAESLCRQALLADTNHAGAHHLLGMVLAGRGDIASGIDHVRRAVRLTPDSFEAHNNLGNLLGTEGHLQEAVASFQEALRLNPGYAAAHNNLGITLQQLGRLDEAAVSYRAALRIRPDVAEAHYHLGLALRDQGHLDEAVVSLREALRLRPNDIVVLEVLGHQLQNMCLWPELHNLSQRIIELVLHGRGSTVAPFWPGNFLCLALATTPEQQLRCAQRWVEQEMQTAAASGSSLGANPATLPPRRGDKITLGYLSADFRDHIAARQVIELFEKHDHNRFSVFGYSYGPDDHSPMRLRVAQALDRFVDVKDLAFDEAARRIQADGVDILIDLTGYTQFSRSRIVALRPAPIQVNFGFPGTMGAPFMDYILVDDFVVPAREQPYFTEKLVHLPGCILVSNNQRPIAARTPSRSECGLPPPLPSPGAGEGKGGGFVFCGFNNSYKITPAMFEVWMRLLQAVPGSALWLQEGNRWVAGNLRREAQARGVAAERLVFAKRLPLLADHLARYRLADLFVDTFPYNAHTTAADALWSGCPVLTLSGETYASRVAGSLLRAIGLPELITTSPEAYEELAIRLAREPDRLGDLRSRLLANRPASALIDSGQFTKNVEAAFSKMWAKYCAGEKPGAFAVGEPGA